MDTNRTTFNQRESLVAKNINCFTLRLPLDLYVEVYDLSVAQRKTLNSTVIDLIKIAMTQKIDVRKALQEMLAREFGPDALTSES